MQDQKDQTDQLDRNDPSWSATAKIPVNDSPVDPVAIDRLEEGDSFMFCTACGTKNTQDANYCKQCGRKIGRSGPLKITEEAFAEAGGKDEQVRAHLTSAYHKYETGDPGGAIESCEKAIDAQPDSTDAYSLLSTLYEKQGEREKAIAAREKVLLLNPGSIADREKLEELRDGTLVITPRKITSSRPVAGHTILDSRAGAAIVAVAATLFVLAAGLGAVLYVRSKPPQVQAQSPAGTLFTGLPRSGSPAANPLPQAGNTGPAPSTGLSGMAGAGSVSAAPPPVNNNFNRPPARSYPQEEDSGPVRQLLPAVVLPYSNTGVSDREPRNNAGSPNTQNTAPNRQGADRGSTVHLPDNGLGPSEIGPSPTGVQNPAAAAPPRGNTGKIEIIVSTDPPGGKTAGGGTGATRHTEASSSSSNMDSRSMRRVAQDYQLKGQYKLAISSYIKALDGAGDDAGSIHYQIGLCYQRLDERENAVSQYTAAVAAYKEQVASGRNVEAATRGIRASEAGIRACQ